MEPHPAYHPALRRVLRDAGDPTLADRLAALPGADLTTLLLEVFRRRASLVSAADVMRQYGRDRFVAPAAVSDTQQRRAEDAMLGALPGEFEVLTLAPVLPLGAHSAVARVDPRNVIATIRGSEVAADPTNGLALEAAARRRAALAAGPRPGAVIRLAAIQRVARAQHVSGPVTFAHFRLLGMVIAGRDTGSYAFERDSAAEHLRSAVTGLRALGAHRIRVELTCLDETMAVAAPAVTEALLDAGGTEVTDAPERQSGRGYYSGLCFKVYVAFGGPELEVGDGGFTDWASKLVGSRKERLLISGYGIDRIAIASQDEAG